MISELKDVNKMVAAICIVGFIILGCGFFKLIERKPFSDIPLNWAVMVGIGSAFLLVGLFGFAKGALWPQMTPEQICVSQSKFWIQGQCTEIQLKD